MYYRFQKCSQETNEQIHDCFQRELEEKGIQVFANIFKLSAVFIIKELVFSVFAGFVLMCLMFACLLGLLCHLF